MKLRLPVASNLCLTTQASSHKCTLCTDIVGANYWPAECMGLEARCFASTENIVLMCPLWKQDSESVKKKGTGGKA